MLHVSSCYITFLKNINTSLSSCSLRDGTISFIKYASRILLLRVFTGALASIYQLNCCFQDFLYRNLYKHEQYENMCPKSNQPGRFFARTKTHKFDSVYDIALDKLKLHPIIDQTGTYIYSGSKKQVFYWWYINISRLILKMQRNQTTVKMFHMHQNNKYSINDTLTFPNLFKKCRGIRRLWRCFTQCREFIHQYSS